MPKTVILLGFISLFTDVSSEMVYPVLPLFLTQTLGAPVLVLGIIEGFAEALVSVLKGVSGLHSDRIRRRVPYIRWGYALAAVSKPMLALATGPIGVFLARSLDRTGKGLRTTARDALITDVVSATQRGRAFGLHRSMDTTGALAGVLLAAALLWWLPGQFKVLFVVAAFFGAIAVALTFALREPAHDALPTDGERYSFVQMGRSMPRSYWLALLVFSIFGLANSSDTLVLLRISNSGFSNSGTLLVYAFYNVSYTVCSYPAGILSDKFGRWRVIGAGWVIYSAVYAGLAIGSGWAMWPLLFAYGISMALTQGVAKALIADMTQKEYRGSALGLFNMATGLAVLPGSAMAGWLWDRYGAPAAFWFGAALATIAFLMLPVLHRIVSREAVKSSQVGLR